MNTPQNPESHPSPAELPEPVVKARKGFSIVWLVPLVAVLIGGWLAYKAMTEKGPTITITFKTAEGLEAGKTKIKYKDVEIGQVNTIDLSPDLSHVVVTAEMVKGTESHLTDKTLFWVVRARVAAGEVSGLGTLFSGAYIGMEPGKAGESQRDFQGLELPPVITADVPGTHFTLQAETLGSLDVGTPVYFRKIKVGQVVSYQLEKDHHTVRVRIFIQAPHDQRVRTNTRFWNASGVNVTLDASGVRVDTQSLISILYGGIAFDIPKEFDEGEPAAAGSTFNLYPTKEATLKPIYTEKKRWIMYFNESVRGLTPGAPVEFRGIQVGQVVDVRLEFDMQTKVFRLPVLIDFEPERLAVVGGETPPEEKDKRAIMDLLVQKGLRAQLEMGSLLTGKLYVNLDIHPEAKPAKIHWDDPYPQMPTIPTPIQEIKTAVVQLLDRLERLPMEQIGQNLNEATQGLDRLVNSGELKQSIAALNASMANLEHITQKFSDSVTPSVAATLDQTRQTMATAQHLLSTNSPLNYEVQMALKELARAARALRAIADYLERHPDALIYGKGKAE